MKNLFSRMLMLMIFIACNQTSLQAAPNKKTYKANVDRATIYRSGATLFISQDINLLPGMNEIVFDGVAASMDQNSVMAYGNGNFTITEAHYFPFYVEAVKDTSKQASRIRKQLKFCVDSINEFQFKLDETSARIATLELEKQLLTSNRYIKGETKKDSLSIFKEAVEFMRSRMTLITADIFKLKREQSFWQEKMNALNARYQQLNETLSLVGNGNGETNLKHQIVVSIMAEVAGPANVAVSYFISQAGWLPMYDIKAFGNKSKLELVQHAKVWQQSGIDFSNVGITLSTGNPGLAFNRPDLQPWVLDIRKKQKQVAVVDQSAMSSVEVLAKKSRAGSYNEQRTESDDVKDLVLYADDYTDKNVSAILAEYQIKLKYDLASGNIPISLLIGKSELNSELEYYCAPKLDQSVYLQAKVTGWEEMNLIPAQARIYFDGSYSGKINFDPQSIGDTLQIDLGKDPAWVITRKKTKEKTTDKVLQDQKIVQYAYQIQVRNAKAISAKLIVEDQIPLSKNENIEVKLLSSTKAIENTETGILRWELDVKSRETKKLEFSYEVKHGSNVLLSKN
jgi:uncharacterized protein (TIGR02231 family)